MKLIDIVKRLPWPDGAVVCEKGAQGVLSYRVGNQVVLVVPVADIADDYAEEVVTRGEWLAAQINQRAAQQHAL